MKNILKKYLIFFNRTTDCFYIIKRHKILFWLYQFEYGVTQYRTYKEAENVIKEDLFLDKAR